MQMKTISVTYDRKFNLGNYRSLNLAVTLWADLEEGDDAEAAVAELQATARKLVKREMRECPDAVAAEREMSTSNGK